VGRSQSKVCVTLLSKMSCDLTNDYSFWPSGKRSILTIGIRAKVTSSIHGGQLLRGRLLRVAQLSCGGGQVTLESWRLDFVVYS